MDLDRAIIERAMETILRLVPSTEVRLVGTASSVLRGIPLPAADVDVLFRERGGLDDWFGALRPRVEVEAAPAWCEDEHQ